MRIPFDVMRDGLASLNRAAELMSAAQRQVSTGRRLNKLSDDPLAAQQAVGERASIGRVDAYSSTNESAAAVLTTADNVMTSYIEKLLRVTVAAMSARGSSANAVSRAAAAAELVSLRDALQADLNTSFNGIYLFSGTQTNLPAYNVAGGVWTYQGNAQTTQVEIDKGRFVSVTFDGQAIALGTDLQDVFAELDALVSAVSTGNDAAIGTGLAAMDRAHDRALRAQAQLGTDQRGTDEARLRLDVFRRAGDARRAALEDANMAEAITRMTQAQTAYQAALSAIGQADKRTLMDYLR
jgi:flagellar hook-associated protein 3 FlgL